jgi:putative glycosyltransferase
MNKISIVTSLYRSSDYINEFYNRTLKSIQALGVNYEFIFVNDGSPDDSEIIVSDIAAKNKHVILINLSRNFGQYAAIFAGMKHASGDYIFILDCDLEEEPENLILFYNLIVEQPKIDVVYGVVKEREGGLVKKYLGKVFYDLLDVFNEHNIPRNQAWLRLMKRKYVEQLLRFTETDTFPSGLMFITGFNQLPFSIQKKYKGSTSYSTSKRVRVAINAITSFNSKPLEYISIMGAAISLFCAILFIVMIFVKIFVIDFQAGWISLITSIWLVGGLILFSLGVIGIYISRIFNQVKNRPPFIIQSILNYEQNSNKS